MGYFWRDMLRILQGSVRLAIGPRNGPEARFAALLAVATLPGVLAGLAFWTSGLAESLHNIQVIAWATIGFGILLYLTDRFGNSRQKLAEMTPLQALFVGCVQICAFVPGASRAGMAITAGRALGLGREDAARFAFLLAIPTIGATTVLGTFEIARTGDTLLWGTAATVLFLSAAVAWLALWGLLRMMRRWSFTPFVIYRLALGAGLLWYAGG